jgi:hypothetical protein
MKTDLWKQAAVAPVFTAALSQKMSPISAAAGDGKTSVFRPVKTSSRHQIKRVKAS